MSKQITCITKPNTQSSHEAITHVGGSGFYITRAQCVSDIRDGRESYHVRAGGYDVSVIAYEREGTWFIKTKPDATQKDNLLSLGQC